MKRYNPRVEQTRKKHVLPAWAVTPTFILGVMIVVAALVMAIFPEQIAPYDPTAVNITARTKAPSTFSVPTITDAISSPAWSGARASICPLAFSACWCR